MGRPVTLFTGQWADLKFEQMCRQAKDMGFDGLEIACWGDHMEVDKALSDESYCENKWRILDEYSLKCLAISSHLVGQATCDLIDERHKAILPDYIWKDGNPDGVRKRAAEELMKTAHVAKKFGVDTVVGFTGSPIWHLLYAFPPTSQEMIEKGYQEFGTIWKPILDEFKSQGVRFALEVHPTEIAFDTVTSERALKAVDFHESFGFNFDPSHFVYQGVDYVGFIRKFADRIFNVHIKDAYSSKTPTEAGVFGGNLDFGDSRRNWDFRSPGRGSVNFEEIIRALNDISYQGPLSVEWEDSKMDRQFGATEAAAFVRQLDFTPCSGGAFDSAFDKEKQ